MNLKPSFAYCVVHERPDLSGRRINYGGCMTTMTRTLAGALCATLAIGSMTAVAVAQSLTADRAVEIALKHNSLIVTSAADMLDARSARYAAASGILPHVGASLARSGSFTDNQPFTGARVIGGQLVTGTGTNDIETYSTSPALQGSWSVLDLSALSSFSASRRGVEAAEKRRTATRNDVTFETRRQFYVVVQASTAAEAVEIALGRYAGATRYGSPHPFQGPERRL